MTKQEIENKIKELQEKLDKGEYDTNIWKPDESEYYYNVDECNGDINEFINRNDKIDTYYFETGNYYKTKEKAEFEAQREKYTRFFRKYVEENSEPCDWDDCNPKYYLYYDEQVKMFNISCCYTSHNGFEIYASNEQVLWDALRFIGKDNFKKYILGIAK